MDASLAGGCWASRLPRLRRLTGKLVPVGYNLPVTLKFPPGNLLNNWVLTRLRRRIQGILLHLQTITLSIAHNVTVSLKFTQCWGISPYVKQREVNSSGVITCEILAVMCI